jgi:hypothetical protein
VDALRLSTLRQVSPRQVQDLLDHGGIRIFELNKFAVQQVETAQERWLKFFNEAESLDDARLPDWMQTPVMRQAMNTLTAFSEQDRAYHAYLATPCLQWAHHSHRHLRFLSAAR